MAQFPKFITTGGTRDLQPVPLQYKPIDLLPLISQIRTQPQEPKGTKKPSFDAKDLEIEGRIGAVNQYMEEANRAMSKINRGFDLYGDSFASMPEYRQSVMDYEYATGKERKNIVNRQTEDVKRFKEQTKGKGTFFHLGEWVRTGKLKKISDWQDIQERGYTKELGQKGDFVEDFDFDPTLYDMADARAEADALYDKHGYRSDQQATGAIEEKLMKNMYGIFKSYQSNMYKRNYGAVDKNGNPTITDENGNTIDLNAAHEQAMSRALQGNLDPTDKLTAGFMQGFLQRQGGLSGYFNKEGILDDAGIEKFQKDFKQFVADDLTQHFNKRKVLETGNEYKEDFDEASPEGYGGFGKAQAAQLAINGMKEHVTSFDQIKTALPEDVLNSFLPITQEEYDSGGGGILDRIGYVNDMKAAGFDNLTAYRNFMKNKMFEGPGSVFKAIPMADGTTSYEVNEDAISSGDFYDKIYNELKGKFKDDRDARNAADEITGQIYDAAKKSKIAMDLGAGKTWMGRDNVFIAEYDANTVNQVFSDALQNDNMIGKDAGQVGTGINVYMGETAMNLSDLSGFTMVNRSGNLMLQPNAAAQNYGVFIKEPTVIGGQKYPAGYILRHSDIAHLPKEEQFKAYNLGPKGFWRFDGSGMALTENGKPVSARPDYTGATVMASEWESAGRAQISEQMAEAGSPQAWTASATGNYMASALEAPEKEAHEKLKKIKVYKEVYPISDKEKELVKKATSKVKVPTGNPAESKKEYYRLLGKELGLSERQSEMLEAEAGPELRLYAGTSLWNQSSKANAILAKYAAIGSGDKGAQNRVLKPVKKLSPIMDSDGTIDPTTALMIQYQKIKDKDGNTKVRIMPIVESTGVLSSQVGKGSSVGAVNMFMNEAHRVANRAIIEKTQKYEPTRNKSNETQEQGGVRTERQQVGIPGITPQRK